MVVGVFPIAKLGALLLRQVSKPIANFAKERAKNNQFFRTYICMPPAQFYNWCEVKSKMWILNLGKPDTVPSLNEEMAIELGANLLGEGIIFVIAAGIIYLEYARQYRKEAAKEAERKEEMEALGYTIRDLAFKVEAQEAEIRQITRMVANLDSRVLRFPWKPFSKSSSQDDENTDESNLKNKNQTISQNKNIPSTENKKITSSAQNDNKNATDDERASGITKAVNYVSNELLFHNNPNDKERSR